MVQPGGEGREGGGDGEHPPIPTYLVWGPGGASASCGWWPCVEQARSSCWALGHSLC